MSSFQMNNQAPEPPSAIEAEQQLLGSLLNNNDLVHGIAGLVEAADFHDPLHKWLFERILAKVAAAEVANVITLRLEVDAPAVKEAFAMVGGAAYLVRLAGFATSSYASKDYAQMIADVAAKRRMLEIFKTAGEEIHRAQQSASTIALSVENAVGSVAAKTSVKPLIRSYLSAMTKAVDQINSAYMGDKSVGVQTGIHDLDRLLGHMRPGNLIIVGGRPAMGKTTLAQNLAWHVMAQGKSVFYGSLEMPGEELAPRFLSLGLAQRGFNVAYSDMLKGNLQPDEMRAVVEEAVGQQNQPMILAERDVRETGRFRAAAKRAHQKMAGTAAPLGMIVVDYIQLLESRIHTRGYDRVSEASDMAKSLAMEFEVPVVALAQLSRAVEMRDPPIPILSDLREAGKLEEDADVVMFTYRDEYYLKARLEAAISKADDKAAMDLRMALETCRGKLDCIVAKHRGGPTGTARAFINLGCCHITNDRAGSADRLI